MPKIPYIAYAAEFILTTQESDALQLYRGYQYLPKCPRYHMSNYCSYVTIPNFHVEICNSNAAGANLMLHYVQ